MDDSRTGDLSTDPELLRASGGGADRSFSAVTYIAGGLVLVILGLITVTMGTRSIRALRHMGTEFVTSKVWNPPAQFYGILGYIWGTVFTSVIAIAMAVPVSLGIALFVTQVAPRRLRAVTVYVIDLLAVVPSVVFGLWGVLVLAPHIVGAYGWLERTFHGWWILGTIFGAPHGRSFFTAGIILGLMITPIIVSIAREVIETTPSLEKEAALALGATKWEMIRAAVIPHSKGGLVGAVILGLGRAMGETIAVALVIGSAAGSVTFNLFASGDSMPAAITNEWGEADSLKKSALIAMAVTLFVMTIVINIAATVIVQRSTRRSRGGT
ncbi:MAG: phosphate ABC transporter permease subunit PstC [Ilumatobacteraceae bacterium]